MTAMTNVSRYVIARERNVVRVDFRREPDPPAPRFPGAAALRKNIQRPIDVLNTSLMKKVASRAGEPWHARNCNQMPRDERYRHDRHRMRWWGCDDQGKTPIKKSFQ